MRLATIIPASTLVIALAGCGARNPVAPVVESGGAAAQDRPFVLSSALDARLPAPMEEAAGATTSDLAITGAASTARSEERGDERNEHARASAEPVLFWNQLTTTLARGAGLPPPRFARAYALTHVAIHDALIAGGDRARGGLTGPALAAGAASTVLTDLFPASAADIAAAAQAQIAGSDRRSVLRSWRLGVRVGELLVLYGRNDRSDMPFTGTIPTGPGIWAGANPVLPMCGEWKTWILRSGGEFKPEPPYTYGTPQDLAEVAEVLDVALHRTPEQIAIVHKWADRSPPAIWCGMLNDEIAARHLSLREAARAHAFLNVAIYDAFVSCWSTKYIHWIARPFMRITDPAFTTAIPTPNFPSYTSGHSTISAAAAAVMGELFPRKARYFREQAAEAAISRLWGGIHFSRDNNEGLRIGRRIGAKTVRVMRHGSGDGFVAADRRD
jgi:hypothetical protein